MKPLTIILVLTFVIIICGTNRHSTDNEQEINPILGDISFVSKFGREPTAATDEDLRIKTHLQYVENILRQKDISHMATGLQVQRKHLLDLLHNYRTMGIFPRNYDYRDRRVPCFIDKDGKICAVGYLIEQTAGRQVSEAINRDHQYDKLLDMDSKIVDSWIATSGLTKEECAMIQPAYGGLPQEPVGNNYISPGYGIATSVLGGVNISLNTINAIQISRGADSKAVAVMSLWSGVGSIILGALNFPDQDVASANQSQKAISMVNIGLGTTTTILGIWNLTTNRQKKPRSVTCNIYSFPTSGKRSGLGLRLTKKI